MRRSRGYATRSKSTKLDAACICIKCKKLMPVGAYAEYKNEGRGKWHLYKSDCAQIDNVSVSQSVVDNDVTHMHGRFFHELQNVSLNGKHTAQSVMTLYDKLIGRMKWSAGKKPSCPVWLISLGCLFATSFDTTTSRNVVSEQDGRHTLFVEKSLSDSDVAKVAVVVDAEGGFPKRIVIGTVGHDGAKKVVKIYNL